MNRSLYTLKTTLQDLPMLTFAWPTVELYNKDSYALHVLTEYLSQGKKAPLNTVLVDDLKLTSSTSMWYWPSELAGQTAT